MTYYACTTNGNCAFNCGYASWSTGGSGTCGSGYGLSTLQPYAVVYKLIKVKKAS